MKSKQVLSIEQMKHLQELGLDASDAEFGFNWWISDKSFDQYYADEVLQRKIEFNE